MKRIALALLFDLLLASSAFAAFGIFQLGHSAGANSFLLLESGDFLLLEDGSKLILE